MGTDSDSDSDSTLGSSAGPTALAVIEEQADATIRRQIHDGRMFFSVIDVIAVLTDSTNPRNYWNMLKRRMSDEGAAETYTKCVQLRMIAADGRQRLTDAADAETLLRIIQSVPSPKAEPVKQWLARVGATELQRADFAAIYGDLNAAFHVGKYSDIPDAQWPQVAEWLQRRIDATGRHR